MIAELDATTFVKTIKVVVDRPKKVSQKNGLLRRK
jgi:hypothetical protein